MELFTIDVLKKLDILENDASITAKVLVNSDLRGIESHSVAHLKPFYVTWIREGKIKKCPELKLTSHSLTSVILDGNSGLGFVTGHYAIAEAIKRAEKTGVELVSVKNSTHCGEAYYSMIPIHYDMIGITMTIGDRIMMAPNSSGRAGGLNPIAVAVPSNKKHPFVLDISTSVVAYGKFEIAKGKGQKIP